MTAIIKSRHIATETRLQAPKALAAGPAAVFRQVVAAVDPGHFSSVDLPLLESFANAADLATKAAAHIEAHGAVIDGKVSAWVGVGERAAKTLTALSARLRICPQSRFDRLVAGSNSRPQPDQGLDDDDDGLLAR